ncbi:DUF1036 domain-containing protein [Rhodovulum sulfidophilum]|uniref:DUF1036 domain-containing protein n=1 Tax=Rhodovulum sulfidophilum TaxID=35806 RepID=A0ABS1RYS6_RHOSU|nr:DUF1036 domain-containing protein [Rhodovulum sulfidophilum]MBL3611241.1 DUF1036 domain-containing protein [Rhodovulum sulfidophilum]MCE8459347.1 DUF1036 domain-containing protein [Rhodovulum sulfidophilum]
MSRAPLACPALLCALLAAAPALAGFSVCNRSLDEVNLALGQPGENGFGTSGWWLIGPGECASPLDRPLDARFLYVFALDAFGRVLLEGATPMCVGPGRFEIRGATDCLTRGYLEARFREIDTGNAADFTLTLHPDAE